MDVNARTAAKVERDIAVLAAAKACRVKTTDVMGRSRHPKVVDARRIAMWLLRADGFSQNKTGWLMERDHTTVIFHCRAVEAWFACGVQRAQQATEARALLDAMKRSGAYQEWLGNWNKEVERMEREEQEAARRQRVAVASARAAAKQVADEAHHGDMTAGACVRANERFVAAMLSAHPELLSVYEASAKRIL